jgi:hypothetical protein
MSNYGHYRVTDNGAFFREADRLDSLIQLIYRLLISTLMVISRHHTDVSGVNYLVRLTTITLAGFD